MQHTRYCFLSFNDFCDSFGIAKIVEKQSFIEAMTHSSLNKNKCYERMEFLGDTILNFCISKMIFEYFPNKKEGEMSKIKSFVISRNVCHDVAKNIKLDSVVMVSNRQHVDKEVILADCVESLICCIYYEYNFDKVFEIIKTIFSPYLSSGNIIDPKMQLQEYTQRKYKCLPIYTLISKNGTEHKPTFLVSASFSKFYVECEGKNKKEAERNCAQKLLEILNINK